MKKSVITIPLLLVLIGITVFFGRQQAVSEREEMASEQYLTEEDIPTNEEDRPETDTNEENDDSANDVSANGLEDYEQRLDSLSLYEQIDHLSLTNDSVTIAYYGDIEPEEEWFNTLNSSIEEFVSGELAIQNMTQPSLDTYELYIQQTAQPVIDENPDIIFYSLPALPDKTRDIGLAETEEYMSSIVTTLSSPEETELVLLEPYPIPQEMNQLNSRSLDYRSYLSTMQTVAENFSLPVLSLHSEFIERTGETSLENYYSEADNELNEEGSSLVSTILDDLFNQ